MEETHNEQPSAPDIKNLTVAINKLTETMQAFIEAQARASSPWMDAEEAAQMLGLPITKSKSHRRRLEAAIKRGIITVFSNTRPRLYGRENIMKLAAKVLTGNVVL